MTKEERQQSLKQAWQACQWLSDHVIAELPRPLREQVSCLVTEFERLDAGEQTRNEAGRQGGKLGAVHGAKGGWPKGKKRK
jgi:hypothetical protein